MLESILFIEILKEIINIYITAHVIVLQQYNLFLSLAETGGK